MNKAKIGDLIVMVEAPEDPWIHIPGYKAIYDSQSIHEVVRIGLHGFEEEDRMVAIHDPSGRVSYIYFREQDYEVVFTK
jgi:hypothetical protein